MSNANQRPSTAWTPKPINDTTTPPKFYGPEINRLLIGLKNHDPKVMAEVRLRYSPHDNESTAA